MHFSTTLLLYVSSAAAVPLSIGTGLGSVTVGSSSGLLGLGGSICLSLLTSSCESTSSGTTTSGTTSSGTTGSTGSSPVASVSSKAASSPSASASASKAAVASISVSSSVPKASSTPAAAVASASAVPNPGVNTIVSDLNAFDTSLINAISALNAFTGGSNINSQALAVASAGQAWQNATLKLLTDAQSLTSKGQFSATDSSKIVSTISGSITTDMVTLYNSIQSNKPEFVQVNAASDVHNGLAGIRYELQEICDALTPLLQSADYPTLQVAANKIYAAALNALNAYASS